MKADESPPNAMQLSDNYLSQHTPERSMFFSWSVLIKWIGSWKTEQIYVTEEQLESFILCS